VNTVRRISGQAGLPSGWIAVRNVSQCVDKRETSSFQRELRTTCRATEHAAPQEVGQLAPAGTEDLQRGGKRSASSQWLQRAASQVGQLAAAGTNDLQRGRKHSTSSRWLQSAASQASVGRPAV